ncbi:MAG: potassium transporter TrkG, partial [Gammaproteobacteria bacterium]
MQLRTIQRILGLLLMLFSLTMLPPVAVAWWYQDGALISFLLGFALIFVAGFLFWAPVNRFRRELRMRDGFVVVTMFWTVLGMTGAVPFMLAKHPHMTFTNAVFESVSGLTTTGATALTGLDVLPHAILYYRAQLQWLGGMGIIVLAVAILPMLGV